MGQITTGIGLISGLPIADIVDQLMAIEARPKGLIEQRTAVLRSTQVAYQSINAQLLGLKGAASGIVANNVFNATTAVSSNESVVTASSGSSAIPGSYSLRVRQLVGSQQTISRGFADTNATFVGAGTLVFDRGLSRIESKTHLDDLNGDEGIERGFLRITDRSGAVGIVDLSNAVTVDDVVNTINNSLDISVIATVTGDGLTLTDNSGLTSNDLIVANAGAGTTATSLGIAGSSATGTIVGTAINAIGEKTLLSSLNDGNGVRTQPGIDFTITDSAGSDAVVDIRDELTLGDLIDTINAAAVKDGANITASISPDGLGITLTDSGGGGPTFTVTSTDAAADLGIAQTDIDSDGLITGERLIAAIDSKLLRYINGGDGFAPRVLQTSTPLADLFDGTGLITGGGAELQIKDKAGNPYFIDFNAATTAADLINEFSLTTGGNVTLEISGNAFAVTDNTGGGEDLVLTELVGSAVSALGLNKTSSAGVLLPSTPLDDLFDGNGLDTSGDATAEVDIVDKLGGTYSIDIDALGASATANDLISAFDTATGGNVTLSIQENKFVVEDHTGGGGSLTLSTPDEGGTALADLGLEQDIPGSTIVGVDPNPVSSGNVILGLDTNPVPPAGSGPGTIRITNRAGADTDIDLTGAVSISDILDAVNTAGAANQISATINRAGNGILISDTTGGTGNLVISDLTGTSALALGLVGTFSDDETDGGDLDLQYVTAARRFEDLGVIRGRFRITDSRGASATVDLTQGNEITVQDVLDEINTRGLSVNSRLNDTGDGILIEDTGPGTVALKIEEDGSSTAADLGILGEADTPGANIDGSFETSITITSLETLTDVRNKINTANVGVSATIINDGSLGAPHRLSLSATKPGTAGAFVFDDGGIGFEAVNLAEAQDAVILLGGASAADALVVTSTSNTLSTLIPGVTINLLTTSDQPVEVNINQDDDAVVDQARQFVDSFNGLIDTIAQHDSFNSDTEERGLLLGDPTVGSVRQTIVNAIIRRNPNLSGQFTALSQIGIKIGSGAKLSLDEADLRAALDTNRTAVEQLFTLRQTELDENGDEIVTARGIGVAIDDLLKRLTDENTGPLQARVDGIDDQIRLNDQRIADLDVLLEARRARLNAEFLAMERILAQLQNQNAALQSIRPLVVPRTTNRTSGV